MAYPLADIFSRMKNTRTPINVGNTLAKRTGMIVSGWPGCTWITSVMIPADFVATKRIPLMAMATPAAFRPAIIDSWKLRLLFMLIGFVYEK
jgi:hypothetical protein